MARVLVTMQAPVYSSRRSIVFIVSILLWVAGAEARRIGFFVGTATAATTSCRPLGTTTGTTKAATCCKAINQLLRKRDILGRSLSLNSVAAHRRPTASERALLKFRGGGGSLRREDENDDDEEEEIEADDDEEEEDDEDLFDSLDMVDGSSIDDASDFTGEDDMSKRLTKAWTKTPPVTKAYLSAAAAAAVCGMALYKNEFPTFMAWNGPRTLRRLELWRLFTSFLNFGPLGIGYILSVQFMWMYMSTLERMNHNKPYDFWIMLLFGMVTMTIGYPVLKLNPRLLGHNLSTYLVYIWSRNHEGVDVSFFDILTFKAELLPWVFLAQTFLLEGEPPLLDLLGIVFGHIYYHLKRIGLLRAPPSLVRWYEKSDGAAVLRELYKPISADFDPV